MLSKRQRQSWSVGCSAFILALGFGVGMGHAAEPTDIAVTHEVRMAAPEPATILSSCDGDEMRYQFEKTMSRIDAELNQLYRKPSDAVTGNRMHDFKQKQQVLSERFYQMEQQAKDSLTWQKHESTWQQLAREMEALLQEIHSNRDFTADNPPEPQRS